MYAAAPGLNTALANCRGAPSLSLINRSSTLLICIIFKKNLKKRKVRGVGKMYSLYCYMLRPLAGKGAIVAGGGAGIGAGI